MGRHQEQAARRREAAQDLPTGEDALGRVGPAEHLVEDTEHAPVLGRVGEHLVHTVDLDAEVAESLDQVVLDIDHREQPKRRPGHRIGSHRRSDLPENRVQRDHLQEGRLAGHVRTGDDDHVSVRPELEIVRHDSVSPEIGVAAAANLEARPIALLRGREHVVAALFREPREAGKHLPLPEGRCLPQDRLAMALQTPLDPGAEVQIPEGEAVPRHRDQTVVAPVQPADATTECGPASVRRPGHSRLELAAQLGEHPGLRGSLHLFRAEPLHRLGQDLDLVDLRADRQDLLQIEHQHGEHDRDRQ